MSELVSNLGVCRFCGSAMIVDCGEEAEQGERDLIATSHCRCPEAREIIDRKIRIERAISAADSLFGVEAGEVGFDPLPDNGVLELIHLSIGLIANGHLKRVALQVDGETRAILSLGAFKKINIERSEVNKQKVDG